jgi:phosphoribosylformimino-5-aminoimidazole carboxamide ribotide isomerase
MEIIPVIDLKGGAVVRARHGDRALYRPIETPLAATSNPVDVVAGLLRLHLFRTLYVADLDAIEGRGDAGACLDRIAERFPTLGLWVDDGCADRPSADTLLAKHAGASLVLGSESQRDTRLLGTLCDDPRVLLSLDFRGDAFQGPPALLADSSVWPTHLIVMTLARVGSGSGPDLDRLQEIIKRAGPRRVYAAGGLRDRGDLAALRAIGAAGVLVASALHDGRLSAEDLAAFA